jgi:thiamine biosynthesis lipoprotein ApbE
MNNHPMSSRTPSSDPLLVPPVANHHVDGSELGSRRPPASPTLVRAAIATSSRAERGDHIRCNAVDPATAASGGPDELTSVSVVGPELALADALATAVFASGETRPGWWRNASPYGIISIAASGRIRYTDNLANIVHVGPSC